MHTIKPLQMKFQICTIVKYQNNQVKTSEFYFAKNGIDKHGIIWQNREGRGKLMFSSKKVVNLIYRVFAGGLFQQNSFQNQQLTNCSWGSIPGKMLNKNVGLYNQAQIFSSNVFGNRRSMSVTLLANNVNFQRH